MRGTILTALALSFILSSGVLAGCAEAATIAPSSASHDCHRMANGCVRVQTNPIIHRQKPGTIAGNHI